MLPFHPAQSESLETRRGLTQNKYPRSLGLTRLMMMMMIMIISSYVRAQARARLPRAKYIIVT